MRRPTLSIPHTMVEGPERKTISEHLRFLSIAYGSVCRLERQILSSENMGNLNADRLTKLRKKAGEVEKMLQAQIKSLENKPLKTLP